jgi:CBS domain containing-hemolysin-like protein
VESSLWIVFAVLLFLDLLVISLRTGLVNARLPQLIEMRTQHPERSLESTLAIIEKISLRVALRFALESLRLLMAVTVYFLLAYYVAQPPFGIALGVIFLAGVIVLSIEFAVEGRVRNHPETWLIGLTPLARALDFILRPFSAFFLALLGKPVVIERLAGTVTEDELKTWVESGESAGGLEQGERQMIYSIFHFGDTLCREIMVPRIDILALEVTTSVPDAIQALTASGHSRVPVYEESIDNVVGLLYAKDLLRASLDNEKPDSIRPFLRPAYFVPEAKKVDELLREMQERSIHMAVVVDEYGGMAGLVTLEDIVEEIVGEIRDEYDQAEERPFSKVSDDEYYFHGRIDLDDVDEVLGTHLVSDLADTLGGYIYGTIGRVPAGGEQVHIENWVLTVEQVSGRRIRKIHAIRAVNPEEEGEE